MKNIEEMMKEINPDIKLDYNFKRSLKNKLEIQSYAKLKNTKNKKINIAKSGFFSFKKDGKNIFEKPKINFFKIFNSLFISGFAAFGMFYYLGGDLFNINNSGNFNDKIFIEKNIEINNSFSTEGFSPLLEIEEETENEIEKNIFQEKNTNHRINTIIIQEESKGLKPSVDKLNETKEKKSGSSINTEILDFIGEEENIEFEIFCEDKKGIIKDNICEYLENKCSKIDFENNKCE